MDITELLAVLVGPDKRAVAGAIEKLARSGSEWKRSEGGRALIAALSSSLLQENAEQRELAAWTLAQIRYEDNFHYLLGAFNRGPWKDQVTASEALGRVGDPRAVETLIIALLEGVWPVPKAAAAALKTIDSRWTKHVMVRAAIPELIARLKADKWFVRQRGAWALSVIGDPDAFKEVGQLLDDPAEEVRSTAARIMAELPPGREHPSPVTRLGEGDLPALITALNSDVTSIRRRAVDALRQLGHAAAIEPLVGMMNDPDQETRRAVLCSLSELGWKPADRHERTLYYINSGNWHEIAPIGKDAIPALREALARSGSTDRVSVVTVLGAIGGEAVISTLVRLLCDPKDKVRRSAIAALGSLGWQPRDDKELTLLSIAWGIWEQAVAIGCAAVPFLIDLLSTSDTDIQAPAIHALGKIGDVRAIDPLIGLLSSKDWKTVALAGDALALISGDSTCRAVIQVLMGVDKRAAREAASLLGRLDHPEAVGPLIQAVEDPQIGPSASSALGSMKNTTVIGSLIKAMQGESASVRCLIAGALGASRSKEAIPVLVNALLFDGAWQVRQSAASSLRNIGWKPEHDRKELSLALALGNEGELIALGVSAVGPLLRELQLGEFGRKTTAAKVLGSIRDQRVLKALINKVGDNTEEEETRIAVAMALGEIGDYCSVMPLLALVREGSSRLAEVAMVSLGKISPDWRKHPSVIYELGVLMQQLDDSDPVIRARAATTVGRLRHLEGIGHLAVLLADSDYSVRKTAITALREIGKDGEIDDLKLYLHNVVSEQQGAALEALRSGQITWGKREGSYASQADYARGNMSRGFATTEESRRKPGCSVSTYYPPEVESGVWNALVAYVYEETSALEVEAEIRSGLAKSKARMREMTTEAKRALEQGSTITVTPSIAGFVFNPPKLKLAFYESWQRFDFRFTAGTAKINAAANGALTIRTNGAVVAVVPLSVFVTTSPERRIESVRNMAVFRAIFASYSHADTRVVERVERVCRLLGMEYLRDGNSLKSGEMWRDRLPELIRRADIFQLFWSSNAVTSRWVREEVNYAIGLKRPNFIWPVYWEEPLPNVPKSLKDIHFFFEPDLCR